MPPNDPKTNPQNGRGQPLPKKEYDLFKNVVKCYEHKQYKKSVKLADTILKKFPNHGETLAMKGLDLNYLGKREEAHALVKLGLMNDMQSHVCWHVYGLLHRSDRNYNEAIKAYKQALRIDSDNLQILRDLSMLQIQMRDLSGFAVTRQTLLHSKPNGKINWLAFALAKHLTGDLRGAVSVIDIYLGTLSEGAPELARGFEASELAMYRNRILSEIPNNQKEALDHLRMCEKVVVDRSAFLMERAKFQYQLGQYGDAKETILQLFNRGMIDNYKLHSMYMCTVLELDNDILEQAMKLPGTRTLPTLLPLTDEQRESLLEAYKTDIYPEYEKSSAAIRIPLNLVEGDRLRKSLDIFIRKGLVKGVPSLCRELSTFWLIERDERYVLANDPIDIKAHPKYKLMVELVDGYLSSLNANNRLLPDDEYEEPPSTLLWAWYLRAGLHEMVAEYPEGIALLDKCIEHTPTAVDVYELKARLLKSAGDIKTAVEVIDAGRDLDRQDRYINNQTTKYMLAAGMEEDALNRISMFTKHEGNPEVNLYDMQCSWYELDLAACYAKKEDYGRALKKYSAVIKHFDDFHEDQFDFHAYCIRKVTLRAYTDVLKFEDNVWGEEYYFRAAKGTIQIYLHLHDNPSDSKKDTEPDYSKMSAAERKKAKAVARKKAAQAKKKEDAKKKNDDTPAENGQQTKKGEKLSPVEEDPEGDDLLKKDPIEEAKNYSSILSKHCPKRIGTWVLQYDVAIRRKKPMMALQALIKMKMLDPSSPEFVIRLADFGSKLPSFQLDGAAKTVVTEETSLLFNGKSVAEYITALAKEARTDPKTSLPLRVAIAETLVKTKSEPVSSAATLIVEGGIESRCVSVDACRAALMTLNGFGGEASGLADQWISAVRARFPLIKDFG
ncbi:NMDA receptor-regulated protein 1 [Nitzschia inconspicua]|uniref:NMDA receptor-regulated protein 1 n=1 Tax=Nitzschia inconspicua TaxID=303405 RepID=A0A9K3LD51_9STRA|nr:NMDA receptor-regulated protein 1 [Nitzschia inconspicua]